MPTDEAFCIFEARLPADLPLIRTVRHTVFIDEQRIPAVMEWDGLDDVCSHALALSDSGTTIGTGRLSSDGRIGRMAVLPGWRNRGVGIAILEMLLQHACRNGYLRVTLDAQRAVTGFYSKAGFTGTGAIFMKAGIEHVPMEKILFIVNN